MERSASRVNGLAKVTTTALLLGWALFGLAGCDQQEVVQNSATRNRAMPVEMQPVSREEVVDRIRAVGSLAADESVIIRPEIAGIVETIRFEEGEPVEADAILVTLNAAEQQASVDQAAATVELSQLSFRRAQDLLAGKMISKQEFDEARNRLKESEAALRRYRVLLDKTILRAPFSGIIGLRHVSPGAYVSPGQDLVNLESIDPVKVEFRVSERFAPALKIGTPVTVAVDAVGDQRFMGTIYAIDPRLDPDARAFAIRARVANPDRTLQPGMFARVEILAERRPDAIVIPEQALWPQGENIYVYRVANGQAELVPVTLGVRFDGKVEIRSGLDTDDEIVTAGQMKLRDGMQVIDIREMTRGNADAGGQPS